MNDCIFCSMVANPDLRERVWENEYFMAFLDDRPVEEGHMLLIPKAHVDYLFDLDDQMYAKFFETAKWLAPFIKQFSGAKRVGLAVEGFGVPHTHMHLIPINHGGELVRPRGELADPEMLAEVARTIKMLIEHSLC